MAFSAIIPIDVGTAPFQKAATPSLDSIDRAVYDTPG
jgi:hypothetical protein